MADQRLRIDRLVVRMRGAGEPQARELAAGLGEAVLRRLEASGALRAQAGAARSIERVDAGTLASRAREQLAAHLAGAVLARLAPPEGER